MGLVTVPMKQYGILRVLLTVNMTYKEYYCSIF